MPVPLLVLVQASVLEAVPALVPAPAQGLVLAQAPALVLILALVLARALVLAIVLALRLAPILVPVLVPVLHGPLSEWLCREGWAQRDMAT